jgi:hypothetical protein
VLDRLDPAVTHHRLLVRLGGGVVAVVAWLGALLAFGLPGWTVAIFGAVAAILVGVWERRAAARGA